MKVNYLLLAVLVGPISMANAECDCTTYPFKPNPPCYGVCVERLSSKPNGKIISVRNIDPGVSVGIWVLSEGDRNSVDFTSIQNKTDLEREALKVLEARDRNH